LAGGPLGVFASALITQRGCLPTTIPELGYAEAAAADAAHTAPTAKIRGTKSKGASIGKVPFGAVSPDERPNRAGRYSKDESVAKSNNLKLP
jgi:hypothetical protein